MPRLRPNLDKELSQKAVRILDFPQATGYLDTIGQSEGMDRSLLSATTRTSLCHDLKHSGPDTVVERLRTVVAEAGGPGETVTQPTYLEKRVDQMDYPLTPPVEGARNDGAFLAAPDS
jgi:hypothetical protein